MWWDEPSEYSPWRPDNLRRRILPNCVSIIQLAVHYQWLNCLNTVSYNISLPNFLPSSVPHPLNSYNGKTRINSNSPRAFACHSPTASGAAEGEATASVPASPPQRLRASQGRQPAMVEAPPGPQGSPPHRPRPGAAAAAAAASAQRPPPPAVVALVSSNRRRRRRLHGSPAQRAPPQRLSASQGRQPATVQPGCRRT